VVRGEKRIERERTQGRYHVTECAYGSFERAIPLPERVAPEKAHAKYKIPTRALPVIKPC
jgi:HSP20 family protein